MIYVVPMKNNQQSPNQNSISISEVNIELIKPNEGIVAFASIVINDSIYLGGIAIHKKLHTSGHRVTYPSKGKFQIWHPINREVSIGIESAVLEKFNALMNR